MTLKIQMLFFLSININPYIYYQLFLTCRAKMREKHMLKRSEADLSKAQKSCRQLDLGKEFIEPMESWFWPKERRQRLLVSKN